MCMYRVALLTIQGYFLWSISSSSQALAQARRVVQVLPDLFLRERGLVYETSRGHTALRHIALTHGWPGKCAQTIPSNR